MDKKKAGKKSKKARGMSKEISGKEKERKKQLELIVGSMVGLIIFIAIIMIVIDASNNFKYAGLSFKRVKEGDLLLYTTDFNIIMLGGKPISGGLYFRNDPRTLKDIAIEGIIKIAIGGKTYVATDPNVAGCEDNMIALTNLGVFLRMIGTDAKSASVDENFAEEHNIAYVTCGENATEQNIVIIVKQTEENFIKKLSKNCYEVDFKNCEIVKSTERFIIGTIAHSTGDYDI